MFLVCSLSVVVCLLLFFLLFYTILIIIIIVVDVVFVVVAVTNFTHKVFHSLQEYLHTACKRFGLFIS